MSGGIFNEEAIIQIIQKFTYVSQKQGWYSILRRDACKTGSSTVLTQKAAVACYSHFFLLCSWPSTYAWLIESIYQPQILVYMLGTALRDFGFLATRLSNTPTSH